jgi:hypothetical protein
MAVIVLEPAGIRIHYYALLLYFARDRGKENDTFAGNLDRGRDKGTLCPSLRTGLVDFLHPALQLMVNSRGDQPTHPLIFQVQSMVDSRYRGGQQALDKS